MSGVFSQLEQGGKTVFSDPFAGSGAVSRLAKSMGYEVHTNDWESYSKAVNSCYIGVNRSEIPELFKELGGIEKAFSLFSHEHMNHEFTPYISRHYAPRSTVNADYYKERLFYTTENALYIDKARSLIEQMYPGYNLSPLQMKEKNILLASLLYEVSTHANTSGVFKACHKGFGGHGKDALGRIMAPMSMEIPFLIDNPYGGMVYQKDAVEFVKGIKGDICYLDPPYNIHQYGSNYFMLNTVALWDKPLVSGERGEDGRYLEKAGIRKDWTNTKSPYCYKKQAPEAFKHLMEHIDSRFIVLSYNTEGIIPFDELYDVMESHGKVNLHIKDYVLYRGGKQSLGRKVHNMELLLVVDRMGRADGKDRKTVERFLQEKKILNLLKRPFHPKRLSRCFDLHKEDITLHEKLKPLKVFNGYKFLETPEDLNLLNRSDLKTIFDKLELCQCSDNLDEVEVLISMLETEKDSKHIRKVQRRLLTVFKKLAFKKYKDIYETVYHKLMEKISCDDPGFLPLKTGLQEINEIAYLRFNG